MKVTEDGTKHRKLQKEGCLQKVSAEQEGYAEAKRPSMKIMNEGKMFIEYVDIDKPYLTVQVGVSIKNGSHCHYKEFRNGYLIF